jgi:hypothetical protein
VSVLVSEQSRSHVKIVFAPPTIGPRPAIFVWVWVDVHTAFYCSGSDWYGKTPGGKFTLQRDAQIDQFKPAERASCQ